MDFSITGELLKKGRETPIINTTDLAKYRLSEMDYGMTIGVAVTRGGRVFVCWVGGGDSPKAFMVLSYNDGAGFRDPILAIDPHDDSLPCDRCAIVGNIWVDGQNRLWLFFNQTLGHFDGCSSDWAIRCDEPDAEELKWSAPIYVWHGETLNKPLVTRGGKWLLPVSLWTRRFITPPFGECYHELDEMRMAHVFTTRDGGESFLRVGGVAFPNSCFDEHMLVERADGSLRMFARTGGGLMESESLDGGASWSEPRYSQIKTVCARFHISRLASGRLLLIKHGEKIDEAPARRSHLAAFLSDDDGETWSDGFLLDERFEISYPDAAQAPDGSIYVTYDRDRARRGEIIICRLTEEDILARGIVAQGSYLGRVAVRPGKAPGDGKTNSLKARLAAGDPAFGIMLSEIYVPNVVRLLAECGFDYLIIDCEHGYFDLAQVANLCAVAQLINLTAIVRVANCERDPIIKYLDMGARGILLSNVSGAEEARRLVNACLYAPEGDRGVSTFRAHTGYRHMDARDAMREANAHMLVICQIESREGVDDIDGILSVDGVDGVLVGPNDLTQHLSIFGQYGSAELSDALNAVALAARRHGKWSGVITSNRKLAGLCADKGMRCISGGSELSALSQGARAALSDLKSAYRGAEEI